MTVSMTLWLMVIMQFKHFIADYPLQGKYMLGKFLKNGWIVPLAAHCGVHFVFTLVITWIASSSPLIGLLCAFVDFAIHFGMDRLKASPDLLGRWNALSKNEFKALLIEKTQLDKLAGFNKDLNVVRFNMQAQKKFRDNVLFWWALGVDQLVHHLTDILTVGIVYWTLK